MGKRQCFENLLGRCFLPVEFVEMEWIGRLKVFDGDGSGGLGVLVGHYLADLREGRSY